jgi:hypothetical protein
MRRVLSDAAGRLGELLMTLRQRNLADGETRLEKCKSRLKLLEEAMQQRNINPLLFIDEIQLIRDLAIDVTRKIDSMKNVWWRKAWGLVQRNFVKLLKPVATALHLPHLLPTGLLTYDPGSTN